MYMRELDKVLITSAFFGWDKKKKNSLPVPLNG